jgi:hypothetical protein
MNKNKKQACSACQSVIIFDAQDLDLVSAVAGRPVGCLMSKQEEGRRVRVNRFGTYLPLRCINDRPATHNQTPFHARLPRRPFYILHSFHLGGVEGCQLQVRPDIKLPSDEDIWFNTVRRTRKGRRLLADLPRGVGEQGFVVGGLFFRLGRLLGAEVALLLDAKVQEAERDGDPVQVVREDGADGGRVLPSKDGVENTPEAAAVEVGVAALGYVKMGAGGRRR